MKKNNINLPSEEQVNKFLMLNGLLDSVVADMKEFSKKNPDETLNPLKVKMINKVLLQIKEILSSDPINEFLELLDDETLPTNSDAVLVIGHFNSAMGQFQNKFYGWDNLELKQRWFTREKPGEIYGGIRVHKIR